MTTAFAIAGMAIVAITAFLIITHTINRTMDLMEENTRLWAHALNPAPTDLAPDLLDRIKDAIAEHLPELPDTPDDPLAPPWWEDRDADGNVILQERETVGSLRPGEPIHPNLPRLDT